MYIFILPLGKVMLKKTHADRKFAEIKFSYSLMGLFTRFSKEIPNINYYVGGELKFRLLF